jgi:hypothetical protein
VSGQASSIANDYAKLRGLIDPWNRLGSKKFPAGTVAIGHVPHVAPEAWLHCLMPPLDQDSLEVLQGEIDRDFPSDLKQLMLLHNGMRLFNGLISVYGLRTSYQRSNMDAMQEQPFDMVRLNTLERPRNVSDELVFFGSIAYALESVAIKPDGTVSVWSKPRNLLLRRVYRSLFDFLVAEAVKANQRFDKDGRDNDYPMKPN